LTRSNHVCSTSLSVLATAAGSGHPGPFARKRPAGNSINNRSVGVFNSRERARTLAMQRTLTSRRPCLGLDLVCGGTADPIRFLTYPEQLLLNVQSRHSLADSCVRQSRASQLRGLKRPPQPRLVVPQISLTHSSRTLYASRVIIKCPNRPLYGVMHKSNDAGWRLVGPPGLEPGTSGL
jgi:hypothetical protein